MMGEPYTHSLEEGYMAKKKRKVQTHKLDMLAPHSGFSSREEMVRAMYDQYQDIVRISRMEKSRAYINTDYDDHY